MERKSAEIIATLRYTLFRTLLKEIATVLLGQIRKDSMRYVFALDREHEDARFASRVLLALVSMFFLAEGPVFLPLENESRHSSRSASVLRLTLTWAKVRNGIEHSPFHTISEASKINDLKMNPISNSNSLSRSVKRKEI